MAAETVASPAPPPAAAAVPGERPRGSLPLRLALLFAAAVVFSSLVAPPLYHALARAGLAGFPFRRLLRRLAELAAAVALGAELRRLWRREQQETWLRPGAAVRRDLWRMAAVAAALTGATLAGEFALGHRVAIAETGFGVVARALVGGAVIGLVTQLVCSGVLLFPYGPPRGRRLLAAASSVAAFFSTAHFLRGTRDPEIVDTLAGWRMWADVPRGIWLYREAWVGLFALGLVLYLLAARQGHPWGAVGAHAAAVAVLQAVGKVSEAPGEEQIFLVNGLLPGYGAGAALLPVILWLAGGALAARAARTANGRC